MKNQEPQGTANDVDPASVDRVVLLRIAEALERIANELEKHSPSPQGRTPFPWDKVSSRVRNCVQEYCESQPTLIWPLTAEQIRSIGWSGMRNVSNFGAGSWKEIEATLRDLGI
jgi:hypothetical protein